jgi:hypothetical protein
MLYEVTIGATQPEVIAIQNTNTSSVPKTKYFWPKCNKNLESGMNFFKDLCSAMVAADIP